MFMSGLFKSAIGFAALFGIILNLRVIVSLNPFWLFVIPFQ